MVRRLAVLLSLLVLSAPSANAIEVDGITFPDTAVVESAPLVLNGAGIRAATIFNIHVYVAALYTAQKSNDPKSIVADRSPKQLIMEFKREIGKEDMQKAWRKSFALNNEDADTRLAQLDDFISVLGDMQVGSRVVLTFTAGGVTLDSKGITKTVEDPAFGAAVLKIWLGDAPPDTGLQEGLLGKE